MRRIILIAYAFFVVLMYAAKPKYDAIHSGTPWFDQNNRPVNAHGACIVKDGGKFYLFGEYKSDTTNAFKGFSCYSSTDLYNWKFEKLVLPVQKSGKLGVNRVGERVKVMKCPKTGEYVMYMHVDDLSYKDQYVGYATSKTINGVYSFKGAILFNNKPVKKWDMGTFKDTNGKGYLITHSGNLFLLADDYKSVKEQLVNNMTPQCEAPVIFKHRNIYYWIGSKLTSWEKNDNYYFTSTSLAGPWIERGIFAPEGTLTWNSQSTFVLQLAGQVDTTYMFMGDRWSFPKQGSAATYVWQPLKVSENNISLAEYKESWQIDLKSGIWNTYTIERKQIQNKDKSIIYAGNWNFPLFNNTYKCKRSDEKDASFSVDFRGTQVGISCLSAPDGGYALVEIKDKTGKIMLSSIIDLYCKYAVLSMPFLSPALPKADYTLSVKVLGEHGNWSDKRKSIYGSTGNYVALKEVYVW